MKQATPCPVVNGDSHGWGFTLISYLQKQQGVDLINTHFGANETILQDAAKLFSMTYEYDHEAKTVRFRRKPN